MGWCKKILGVLGITVAIVAILFGTHSGRYHFYKLTCSLDGYNMVPVAAKLPLRMATMASSIIACILDSGCEIPPPEFSVFFRRLTGDSGYAPGWGADGTVATSHAKYVEHIYDVNLSRFPDMTLGANVSAIYPGIIPKHTVLNMNTNDPERVQRREMMSDALHALRRLPTRPALTAPSWASRDGDNDVMKKMVALNIFKWLFDVDLDDSAVGDLVELNELTSPVVIGLKGGSAELAERCTVLYNRLEERIMASETGKRYMSMATARGMDARERVHELMAVIMFAGLGGTSAFTMNTVNRIRSNPSRYVPLYLENKDAFLKESARLNPPVGGTSSRVTEDKVVELFGGEWSGLQHTLKKDSILLMWIHSANTDRNVWGGDEKSQERALEFDPTRSNLDQIMNWNGFIGDIERGHAPPGTPGHAPRACPGAIFALQMTERLVDYFLPEVTASNSARGEL